MSKVPNSFPTERKNLDRCGDSWASPLTVTGLIPGTAFGAAFEHTIEPVLSYVSPDVGKSETTADALRDKIQTAIDVMRGELQGDDTISATNEKAIDWLLIHAEAELASVFKLYDKWRYREWGSFPLEMSGLDDVAFADCSGKLGEYVNVATAGRDLKLRCPTQGELVQRAKDRSKIRGRFMDALRHLRCAQFGWWRASLVAAAKAKLPSDGPGGFTTTQVTLDSLGPIVGIPAAVGWDDDADFLGLPDTDVLPPPDEVPEDEEPEPGPEGAGEGARPAAQKLTPGKAAVAVGVLGVAYLLFRK